jgi:hypothetical protein
MSSACIAVGSREPLFFSADVGNAAAPRTGLWVSPDADCRFDPSAPASEWPDCANATVVRAHVLGPPNDPAHLMDYVLTGTDPRILQMPWPMSDRKKGAPSYSYVGVKPTRTDDQGRFVEAQVWIVLCGEQTPPGRNLETDRKTAPPEDFKPFKGMDWRKGDDFCVTDSKDGVLAAAKASQGWNTDPITAQWVRDAEN